MKNNTSTRPTRSKFTLLHQLANLIPTHLVPSLGRKLGIDSKARAFSLWSHVVRLLYAQLTRALSLNALADGLRLHRNKLAALRGANAVKWQVWTALITCLLLRCQAFVSRWSGSFIRLFGLVRSALWERLDMIDLLRRVCGTAVGRKGRVSRQVRRKELESLF